MVFLSRCTQNRETVPVTATTDISKNEPKDQAEEELKNITFPISTKASLITDIIHRSSTSQPTDHTHHGLCIIYIHKPAFEIY